MHDKLIKRAKEIDQIISSNISEKITLEEADKIVTVWGSFLEHTGFMTILFTDDIPESILPYTKNILVGAINKMVEHYSIKGNHRMVKNLNDTLFGLTSYTNDAEAINEAIKNFSNKKWLENFLPGLKEFQETQMENGFIVNKEIWGISKERINELKK